jgi:glycosyltransferase involved in cell wall biosynthesis
VREQAIWIAWEKQRRTTELARALSIPLYRYLFRGFYPLRVLIVLTQTLARLCWSRPRVLIVQNPSIVLAAFACVLKRPLGMKLIVDRHSNFKMETATSRELRFRIFHILSRYSVRAATLTIVTNEYLRDLVESWGGRAIVLPDKIPALESTSLRSLGPGWHVLYICSFDEDEPLSVVLEAARNIGAGATVHITGDNTRAVAGLVASAPSNVVFTGYLSDAAYVSLLASCDVVLTLTTQDHTLQCGAYEAVAMGKPLVFANHPAMAAYFYKGSVPTRIDPESLADALQYAWTNRDRLNLECLDLRQELELTWEQQFSTVRGLLF